MKRAQELRVGVFSSAKIEKSRETMQRVTSQLQSVQEQINSMNDSSEFQEVESNHSGRLSRVPSQPEVIPSSSSMLSRDKRLPFDTWNAPHLVCPEILPQGIHCGVAHTTQRETGSVPRAIGTGSPQYRCLQDGRRLEFVNTGGNSAEPYGWTAKTAIFGTAIRQIPYFTPFYVGR